MQLQRKAQHSTLQSFLNSFIRDFESDDVYRIDGQRLIVNTPDGELSLGIAGHSLLHQHRYTGDIYFKNQKLELDQFLEVFAHTFCPQNKEGFISNVLESQQNIKNNLEARPQLNMENYLDSEKNLLLGHPFHPWPKLKKGPSAKDIIQYAPEFKGKFRLQWVYVDASQVGGEGFSGPLQQLQEFDEIVPKPGLVAIPFHPWQWKVMRTHPSLEELDIKHTQEGQHHFHALSSMRSYFHKDSPWLLKSSLRVKLTNSIRILEQDEVKRGLALLNVIKGEQLLDESSKLQVLGEPGFVYLKDNNGQPLEDSILQFRENFKTDQDLGRTYLLSGLLEKHPLEKRSKLDQLIEKIAQESTQSTTYAKKVWFDSFLNSVLAPILDLSCEQGVLLGAHLQNLIIELKDDLPDRVFYRDFQGSGFTQELYSKLKDKYPNSFHDKKVILEREEMNQLFGYYLIVNTTFSVISTLGDGDSNSEFGLLSDLRNFIWMRHKRSPHSFYEFLLHSPHLHQKGNMRCSLEQLNETTESSPWKIYSKIKNPLVSLREVSSVPYGKSVYQSTTRRENLLNIRGLTEDDLDLFHHWHHQDYVKDFWELDVSREEHHKIIKKLIDSPYQDPLIVELNGTPFAYFEVYWAYEDRIAPYCSPQLHDRGLHLLIGDKKFIRTRHVYDAMLHVTKYLFEHDEKTQSIWAEPRSDNTKIMRFCEKLPGWRFIKEFDFPHKRSALLQCERKAFYKELKNAL